jgi:hypothetical protein
MDAAEKISRWHPVPMDDLGDPNCPRCLRRMTLIGPMHKLY